MAVLTAKEVTNLYLYGQKTVPSDLTAESLIRLYTATLRLFQIKRVQQ